MLILKRLLESPGFIVVVALLVWSPTYLQEQRGWPRGLLIAGAQRAASLGGVPMRR